MKKQYLLIPQGSCSITIEQKILENITNLNNLVLSKNKFSHIIWNYHKKNSNEKGFIVHLDLFFSDGYVKFSNKGILMLKKFENCTFGIFTNNIVGNYIALENKKVPLNKKSLKLFPQNLLSGIFSGMYIKRNKPIFCLELDKCFAAYKHLAN